MNEMLAKIQTDAG